MAAGWKSFILNKKVLGLMSKMPLSKKKYQEIMTEAKERQLAEILMELDDFSFIKAERAMYKTCQYTQKRVLAEMIRAGRETEFGKAHHFDKIRSIEDYRKYVPISDWEDYAPYSDRLGRGEEDILFPGKPTYFYRTSGTTASYKFIPESEREVTGRKAINRARNTEVFLMCGPRTANRIFGFYNRASFEVSEGGIKMGTASGRTAELTDPELLKNLAYPPQLVNEFDGEELLYMMLRVALCHRDMSLIIGNNALMVKNLVEYGQAHAEELIEDIRTGACRYEMSDSLRELIKDQLIPNEERAAELQELFWNDHFTPRYYWPELVGAEFWLGGSVGVYVDAVRPLLPEQTEYIDVGYGASETKINVPMQPETPAGALAIFCGFFEFIPENGGEPLLAHELEAGKNYEIVLTTYAGLYRYRLKDLVHVDSFTGTTPNLYFVSKLADVANIAQEKIPGSMLAEAIRKTTEKSGNSCRIAQVFPDSANERYVVCIETEAQPEDPGAFEQYMDEGMRKELVQYDTYRGKLLHACQVVQMKTGWSEYLMKKYSKGNATVAQVKVPVVIGEMPEAEWILSSDSVSI